jgi:hypothetical protein
MLAHNQASLAAQTDNDFTQTLLNDPDGRGIAWANRNLGQYAPFLVGQYIFILDDDDMLICPTFIAELKEIVKAHRPDVIFVKMDHKKRGILPDKSWGCEPKHSDIGCSGFVVRRKIWQKFSRHWDASYAGDFGFISAVFASNPKVFWHDVIASQVQRISNGAAE